VHHGVNADRRDAKGIGRPDSCNRPVYFEIQVGIRVVVCHEKGRHPDAVLGELLSKRVYPLRCIQSYPFVAGRTDTADRAIPVELEFYCVESEGV